tara:strand:- start:46 stop:399 length:354 start_codon:yes stop_codon:yes gene_type:complete
MFNNNNNNKEKTMPTPKCITCGKNLKRRSQTYYSKKEPYSGNMICYREKTRPPEPDIPPDNPHDKVTILGRPYPVYDYTLWDGVSYYYYLGRYRFCGVNCAARYGIKHLPKKERGGL